jgi:hypothetical protein
MDCVEFSTLFSGEPYHFHAKHLKSVIKDLFQNIADQISLHGIGFND